MHVLKYIELTEIHWGVWTLIASAGISIVLCIMFTAMADDFNGKRKQSTNTIFKFLSRSTYALLMAAMLLLSMFEPIFGIPHRVHNGRYQVVVKVEDDFPFNSIMKLYNVIDQDGVYYILEPKEDALNNV